jgi:hypothetical protein
MGNGSMESLSDKLPGAPATDTSAIKAGRRQHNADAAQRWNKSSARLLISS